MDIYENRNEYRTHVHQKDIATYRVTIKETDLFIASSGRKEQEAAKAVSAVREIIEKEIRKDPSFLHSLHPLDITGEDGELIKRMKWAGIHAHVGPMASVAGMISEYVGKAIQTKEYETIIVENGGDIYLRSEEPLNVEIHAPGSPLSSKLALQVECKDGMGVCTSSGTYGHSLSFGKSQAAVVVSKDTALADAAATRLGNLLKDTSSIEHALNKIMEVPGVLGAVAIVDDRIGFMGEIKLVAAG